MESPTLPIRWPLYFVETLTDEVERLAWVYIDRIDERAARRSPVSSGVQQSEIEQRVRIRKSIDDDERSSRPTSSRSPPTGDRPSSSRRPDLERGQKASLAEFKSARDTSLVEARLADVTAAASGTQNLLYPMKEALRANATLGEVSDALRAVFGVYRAGS